jgi:predicted nucleic acid-binding protein
VIFLDAGAFVARVQELYSSRELQILRPTHTDELAALELFEKFADQQVSFTDSVSFALMRRAGLDTVFSFDQHFVRAGFKLWA